MPKRYSGQILHLPGKIQSSYFAGGIWLVNLRQMRADGLTKDIVEIMRNPPVRLLWNDQDVMNLACRDKVTYISYRYCSIPHWKAEFKKTGLHDEHFPSGELSEALFRPKIVHYAATKPWNGPCEQDDLWHYWHSRTGFAPVASKFDKAENVSVYLFKYLKLPTGLVKARFRGGVLEVKVAGFVLRIRLSRFEEQ